MKKTATPVAAPNAQQGDDQVEEDEGSASSVAQQIPSKRVLPMENNSPLGNTRVGQGMSMDVDPSSFAATREPTADSAHKKTKVDSTHSMAPSSVSSATSSPFKTTSIAALVNPTEDEEEE